MKTNWTSNLKALVTTLLIASAVHAQPLSYQFEVDNDSYYAITGGTLVTDSFSENSYAVNAPGFRAFDFPLGNVFAVGKNGFVVNTSSAASRSFAFDPLLTGLRKHATLQSELRVLIYLPPSSNDSIFIVEWENMGLENMPDEDFVNFQMWLHRPSQTIEFRYGQSQVSSDSMLAALGGVTADIALLSTNFNVSYEQQWLNGNPLAPQIGTDPNTPLTLDAVPPAGTVYRFTNVITSTGNIANNEISIYPNPCSDFLVVQQPHSDVPLHYAIYNALGQQIEKAETASPTIDMQQLQPGLYVLEIEQGKSRQCIRFVKN